MTDPDRRIALIIWGALVAGVTMFSTVTLALLPLGRTGDPGVAFALLAVSVVVSITAVAAAWFWAVRIVPSSPSGTAQTPGVVARARLIVAAALCEGSALFAVVAYLATHDARLLAPFALSFGALLAQFPGERHWARLGGAGAGRPGTNRLMRG